MLDIKAIDEICEKNNFYDKIDETMWSDGAGIMISQSTPEGEDWSEDFNWDKDNMQVFIDSLKNRIDGWDSEEEAMPYIEMRGQRGVPSSIRDLLNDADWKLEQLKALYTDLVNYRDNNTNVEKKTESVSYNDLVIAGEDLWGEDGSVYDTSIEGIYDCSTAGHGGYLVDTSVFPELAKYGDRTIIDNIVGFEEDYEALKILWIFPRLIKSEDFKNKLNLDMVLAYDEDKSFEKEFPTMGGNITMTEGKLNEAIQVRCKETYNEDGDEYWTKGNVYTASNLDGNNWSIITNFGNKGKVGPDYMLDDFDEYFEVLEESKNCIKEEKTKLNFSENVDELPNMCYGVLPSDNSIIIIKKGESGYFLTNKDYGSEYADITDWNLRNEKADEICNKLNAELGVTPDQRFTMESRSINGNWEDKIEERNLTRAERYNRNLDKIFDRYNKQIDRYCEFLRRLGYDENRIENAKHNTGLNSHELWDIVQPEAEKLGPNVWSDLNDLNVDMDTIIPNNNTEQNSGKINESKNESYNINNNIADTFKNYEAFKNNFEDVIIVKSPYNKNYLIYTIDSKNDDDYIYYSDSKDNIEGWLAGAVKANNNIIKPRG